MKDLLASLILVSLSISTFAEVDEIVLQNDDRVSGELRGISANTVTIHTDYAGLLFLRQESVAFIVTNEPFVVVMKDGEEKIVAFDESIDVSTVVQARTSNNVMSHLTTSWSKQVTFSLAGTKGNSQTQNYSINGQSRLVRPKNEHLVSIDYLREHVEDETRKDTLDAKYRIRWIRGGKWFNTANVDYFRDPLKEVTWRAVVGLGGGAKLVDHSQEQFSFDVAASGVYETLENLREVSPAVRIGTDYQKWLFGGRVEAYQNNRLLWITQKSNGVLDSANGIRLAISAQFNFDLRATVQYETEPAADVKSADFTYSFGVGVIF
ncbi:MAG: DUF481 domain-containing protein [Gammaproteobacteria bacterium]|nr:DUF481 domain-containing protein [Gammaproteobacteria bacterium]